MEKITLDRFKLGIAVLLVGFSLILSACGTAAPAPAPTSTAPTSAPAAATLAGPAQPAATEVPTVPAAGGGGTVSLIIPEEPTTLNYYASDAAIVRQVADATSMTGLDTVNEKGEFVPVLADGLPTEANGGLAADHLSVTWKLLPGLKWSDGQAITSDDIKFTWEVLSNPKAGVLSGAGGVNLIQTIETPDEMTAVVKYSKPYAGYLAQFAYGLLPRHATGKAEEMSSWAWNRKPVGAGPFMVTEWTSGESITLERNPYYFQAGKPSLDKLIFRIVPEPASQLALMMQGETQVQLWPGIDDAAEYEKTVGKGAHEVLVPGVWNMAIDFNLSKPFDKDPGATPPHPILGDLRVRQAIAYAINYDSLVKDVLRNTVKPSTNPFAYGWYQCDLPRAYPFDLEKAKQLLDEAGWAPGKDGIRVSKGAKYAKDGTRLSLELQGYTNYEPLQRTEEFIVENLKAAGIEIRIQNYDFSIIFGTYSDNSPRMIGDYDMLIYDRSFTVEPQGAVEDTYLSTNIPSPANPTGGNFRRWINADADAAIKAAGATFDLAARKTAYCKLGDLITKDVAQIYTYVFQDGYGFSNNLEGYTVSTWGSMVWDVQNWKYKK
jgi:peptide/nickel transport system substrate-binding protein